MGFSLCGGIAPPLSAKRNPTVSLPLEGKVPEGRMRCSANGASLRHKATFFALKTVPLARNLHLISQLTLTAVSLRLGQAWLLTSPGGQFTTKPLLRSPQGEAKEESCRAGRKTNDLCPEYGNFLRSVPRLCHLPLPACPFPRGVSGGGAALSPGFSLHLCPLSKHGAHSAAQSPECAFLAKPFFAQAKNGVNLRRRSHKISDMKAKTA